MRQAVKDAWMEMNTPLEGCLKYLYADVLNLVTTGMGNLVDPVSAAMGLPWQLDGRAARGDEIAAQWWRVKNDPLCARRGHLYAKTLTTMRLTDDGVQALVFRKLEGNDAVLTARFQDMQDWPAAAIMATHSLAWACGPSFHFPKLAEALNARDFEAAAIHCTINEWNGSIHNTGVIPRNVANRILYRNAARVDAFKLNPDLINWDAVLGVQDADTQPDIHLPSSLPPEEPGSYAAAMQSLAELAKFNAAPVRLTEDTAADHPTRAPKGGDVKFRNPEDSRPGFELDAADYLGSDPDDDAA